MKKYFICDGVPYYIDNVRGGRTLPASRRITRAQAIAIAIDQDSFIFPVEALSRTIVEGRGLSVIVDDPIELLIEAGYVSPRHFKNPYIIPYEELDQWDLYWELQKDPESAPEESDR